MSTWPIATTHGPIGHPRRSAVMGILNVTPDSFSDGGRQYELGAAVAAGERLVVEGADLIDVGGESTRPGAAAVSAEEQIRRTAPVIAELRRRGVTVPISIDTRLAAVAAAALDAGADAINDVSGLRFDAALAALAARRAAAVIVMHMRGTPETMMSQCAYADVVAEVRSELAERVSAAEAAGVDRERILIDPGFGFSKEPAQNWELLRRLDELATLGRPIVAGPSRKRFIRACVGSDADAVRMGTAAVVAACCLQGAAVVRVHDVAAMRSVVETCAALADGARG